MKKLTIVGGSRGLGFSILKKIYLDYDCIYLIDKVAPMEQIDNVQFCEFDLFSNKISDIDENIFDVDDLVITAGVGYIKPFENTSYVEVEKTIKVNSLSIALLIKRFYKNLLSSKNASCLIVGSIAGEVCSPLFAVYGASKSSIIKMSESLNIELEKSGSTNRITCVIGSFFGGTSFYGGKTDSKQLEPITDECVLAMKNKENIHYLNKTLCNDIRNRYLLDSHEFGMSSFDYKISSGRVNSKKNIVVGYMSGTFDLFHIGHLNIIKKAKKECDYLIVGVHESGAWKGKETFIPFDERMEIVRSICYVDKAIKSFNEDSDAWKELHFDKLFVGSDYKGTARFKKYETYFADKGVEIVYFPYTLGTSSTQLRDFISKK